ncbi:3-keto-L-gulonate-6-phosphate decarboxylase UlaD [Candidatus Mycoplasma pogonae]
MNHKPMLQIACDTLTVEEAIENVNKVKDYVDVVEAGTILINSVGKHAVAELKKAFPDKIIIADVKVADAGKVFGNMFFGEGAKYVTAICASEPETMEVLNQEGKKFNSENEIQVELTSNFCFDQAFKWKKAGVNQVVLHRARDAQAAGVEWCEKDLETVRQFADLGFKVSVTGGVEKKDIKFFKGLPVYIFIAGRSIRDSENPALAAKELKDEINKYW